MTTAIVTQFPAPTPHRADVAAAVRAHLAVRNIKDAAAARQIGMAQSTFSRRTNGDIAFDIDELGRLANVLGLSLGELIAMPKNRPLD